jgi:hypothetical protein
MAMTELDEKELARGELLLRANRDRDTGLSMGSDLDVAAWFINHGDALLASARQLLELTEALLYLHARNFDGHGWHPDKVVDLALRVGWQPRKDGGNG